MVVRKGYNVMPPRQVTVRVVVFQEGEVVCAQGLEYDIAAQGPTVDDCLYEFERLVVGHIAISLEHGLEPFKGLQPAPEKFWTLFEQSRIPLHATRVSFSGKELDRAGVVVGPPEIRVASLQAA